MKTLAVLLSVTALVALVACSSSSSGTSGGGGACGTLDGTYSVNESFSSSCPSTTAVNDSRTVTVTGTDVKITNGMTYLVHCTLSGCDCTDKGGSVFTFSATGYTASETDSGCTITTTATKN